jgi:hypothetical protein
MGKEANMEGPAAILGDWTIPFRPERRNVTLSLLFLYI